MTITLLGGCRVIELAEALAGPYCAMLLGDLGADIIKIERPNVGDQSRKWGQRLPGNESAYFCSTNRNKRSLTLNIKSPAGQNIMQRLLASSDILVCNIPRMESLQRAGLDPIALRSKFPHLIIAFITGYGHTGPYAGRSGYDIVAQGESSLMSITGSQETAPIRYPIPLADMTTGIYTALGILAALIAREKIGEGQIIDMSLLESQTSWLTIIAGDFFASGIPPIPLGNLHPSIVPYQIFNTADKELIVAVGSEKLWKQFCDLLGFDANVRDNPKFVTNQERLKNRQELTNLVQAILKKQTLEYWLRKLRGAKIPCGPINSVPDILTDPHYLDRSNIVEMEHNSDKFRSLANPVRLSETPAIYRLPPPQLGEHTDAILKEFDYSKSEITGLRNTGII